MDGLHAGYAKPADVNGLRVAGHSCLEWLAIPG
jgi:hypothetical protein